LMDDYGFNLISTEEASHMDLPNSSGLFSELFVKMENEIKNKTKNQVDYRHALLLSPEEKNVSFLNRYFVFKKVRSVDAAQISNSIIKKMNKDQINEYVSTEQSRTNDVVDVPIPAVPKATKKKLVLKPMIKNKSIDAPPIATPPIATPPIATKMDEPQTNFPMPPRRRIVPKPKVKIQDIV
jgi:hypothetical protein